MNEPKKIPKRLQLKDTHPTAVKLSKLMDLADKLGISISFYHERVLIEDRDRSKELPPLYVEDIEEGHWFQGFPFETEYKLVYENPEYIAQQKKEKEEDDQRRAEAFRLTQEKLKKEAQEFLERRLKETELAERKQLAALKEKYE